MTDFEHGEEEGGSAELIPQNIARLVFGEFSVGPDEGSGDQYARPTMPDMPPQIGGIALRPPGTEPILELNQS